MENNSEAYLKELIDEIEEKKEEGKKGVFRIGVSLHPEVAKYVKDYLYSKPEYLTEVHSCTGCNGTKWDIIIKFRKWRESSG